MPDGRKYWAIPRYAVLTGAAVLAAAVTVTIALAIQDRTDRRLTSDIERTQSDLLRLGARITAIKDVDLTTTTDYIAAFAQIEPLQKEYDEKLNKFSDLYSYARERSEEHTSELQSRLHLVCRLLLEKKKK